MQFLDYFRKPQMDASNELLRETEPSAIVTVDGIVRRLNAPMTTVLGRPEDQCVGRDLTALLSADQAVLARRLLAQGAMDHPRAMAVLVLPGSEASLACLFKAQPAADAADGEKLVWIRSLSARNDLAGLLIPFQLAAKSAGIALWTYSPAKRQLEWLGGVPVITKYSPKPTLSLAWVIARCHPDDREALRQLMRPPSAPVQPPAVE
jgi:PAS domain-containing protein